MHGLNQLGVRLDLAAPEPGERLVEQRSRFDSMSLPGGTFYLA
jgi:hypothetical protein